MKRLLIIGIALLVLASVAFAGQGNPVFNSTYSMYSLATSSTGTITTSNANFDNTIQNIGCTIYSAPAVSVSVAAFASVATGTGFVALSTATSNTTPIYLKFTGNPINSMNLGIRTDSTGSATVINATCSGLQ